MSSEKMTAGEREVYRQIQVLLVFLGTLPESMRVNDSPVWSMALAFVEHSGTGGSEAKGLLVVVK